MKNLMLLVCISLSFTVVHGQRDLRKEPPYASKTPIKAARLFGIGIISTREYELTTTFTPDGRTAFYTLSTPSYGRRHTIVYSNFKNGKWSTPEVASFSGMWSDADPFVSPDGKRIYFISNRPVSGNQPKNDFDIYYVEQKGSGWGEAKSIGAPVNSDASELYITVTNDKTAYFVASRPDTKGQGDIYRSRYVNGKYLEPENLGDVINSRNHDTTPYISPDESFLVFASGNRTGGFGDLDLYISHRLPSGWTQPVNLGPNINSSSRDFCPILSPDGRYLFFSSERGFPDLQPGDTLTYKKLSSIFASPLNSLGNVFYVDIATQKAFNSSQ